jgi:hypothetical protein
VAAVDAFGDLLLASFSDPHRALIEIIAAADEGGWFVIRVQWDRPLSVTLVDPSTDAMVTVADELGLHLAAIVRGMKRPVVR